MSQYLVHLEQTGYLKTLKTKMKHWEIFLTLLKQVQRKKKYINIKYFFIHFFLKTLANFSICCVIWVCDLTRGLKKNSVCTCSTWFCPNQAVSLQRANETLFKHWLCIHPLMCLEKEIIVLSSDKYHWKD